MMSCKEGDPARGVLDFVTSENEGIRHTGSTEEEGVKQFLWRFGIAPNTYQPNL